MRQASITTEPIFDGFPIRFLHKTATLILSTALAVLSLASGNPADSAETLRVPNIVLILADDLGYADVGCFGGKQLSTPHLDRMAQEGIRLTDFYVAQAVCSASRAAILTGCYPNRIGIQGALGPASQVGIADKETTLAELVKSKRYATGIFGKWHLGHHPQFLPLRHGFDEYFGLPYSNDMWPRHPTAKFPDLPLIEGNRIIEYNPDQSQLTKWYGERSVQFIEQHRDEPFFLFLAHAMPHVPLFASEKFSGQSPRGLFGDVIAEIDWSVGQILEALQRCEIDDRTLVIFTSDNGPWLSYGDHAGSAEPLREGKGTAWDGGVRVPFIARWPGQIRAGAISEEPAATIDILPTVAKLIDASLPDHPLDGKDIGPLLWGDGAARSPHEALFFYWGRELHAVRSGRWKLHLPHAYRSLKEAGTSGRPGPYEQKRTNKALYDLAKDPGESQNLIEDHPEVAARLESLAEAQRLILGDSLNQQSGQQVRAVGQLVP